MKVLAAALLSALLLAGCGQMGPVKPDPPADWSQDYGLHCMHPPCSHESPVLPGIVLSADRTDDGTVHTLDVAVRNDGDGTYHYLWVPSCDLHPWIERITGQPGEVQPREPEAHCQPCGTAPLAPGATLSHRFEWDERVWDPLEGNMRGAPSGRYVWVVQFAATDDQQDVCKMDRRISMNFWVDVE